MRTEVCKKCNCTFYPKGYSSELWYPNLCYNCRKKQEEIDGMMKLLGAKVREVFIDTDKDTYILTFDNGLKLTAEDGEYGDNAFSFVE